WRPVPLRRFTCYSPIPGQNGDIIGGVLSHPSSYPPFIAPFLPEAYFTLPLITRITFTRSKELSLPWTYLSSRASNIIFHPLASNRNMSLVDFPFIDCCCERFHQSGKLAFAILHRRTEF